MLMFSGNRFRVKGFLASLSALVALAGMLVGARVAAADSVWVQSYERSSQSQACVGQAGETPWQSSWGTDSSWTPSWEQWANGGKGGWTCTRSITWARSTPSARSYSIGDIGPGGGRVFLISGGLTYEMAPKNWNDPTNPSATDPNLTWCDNETTDVSGASGTPVGTGAANTAAMAASVACSSNAAAAVQTYAPTGTTAGQWFLPSLDELIAMCNYSRNPSSPPTGGCSPLTQDATFASSTYGFSSNYYWSSSQVDILSSYSRNFVDGAYNVGYKTNRAPGPTALMVRPIRAF